MKRQATGSRSRGLRCPLAGWTLLMVVAMSATAPAMARPAVQASSNPSVSTTNPSVSTTQTKANTSEVNDAYTLGAGDRIRIEVFKVPQYSGENQVLVDGNLNLPQVGNVSVEGMTLKEAADAISAQYSEVLRYPFVTVTLLTPRPIKVGIAGEVNRPGAYTIPTDAGSQLPTVTRALQIAGGITQLANLRQVKVRRPQRGSEDLVIQVDLWDFLKTGNTRRDITLRSGDSLYIPTLKTTNLAESVQLSTASFAADRSQSLNIAVVGEVYRPGPHTVAASARTGAAGETGQSGGGDRPPTITRAIQVAGGIRPEADIRRIQVRRVARSGTEQTITINLWELLKSGDLNQDLILQDRDTVLVPKATALTPAEIAQVAAASFSPDSIRVNIVGEVKAPGVVRVPPNTPLTQALLAAGGFNMRARQRSVDLIRLNTDGTTTRRRIAVDFARGIDEQNNPPLRNDDIVVVNRSVLTTFSDNLGAVLTPINGFISVFSIFRILGGQ